MSEKTIYSESNLPSKWEGDRGSFSRDMFIRKNGHAYHQLGFDPPNDCYDCEAIRVYGEDGDYWVGHYYEGFGLLDIRFLKSDCRPATAEESGWLKANDGKRIHAVKFQPSVL